jgi:hypothetical protein
MARAVRSSVVRLGVRAAELSWVVARPDGICPASLRRHPAVGRRRRGRHCQHTSPGVGGRSVPSVGCPPIPMSLSGVRLSSPSGVQSVRCPVTWGRRPGSGRLLSTRPASSRLLSALVVRTRPPRLTSGRGVGDQAHAAGNRHHRVGVDVPIGGRAVGWLGRRPSKPGGRRCRGRALGSRDVGGRPGPGWVRAAAYPQSDQAGQAGVRSAGGWRREGTGAGWRCEVAAPAA